MINYYAKFIPHLARKLSPLYELIRKNAVFEWTKECEQAFLEAKKEIASEKWLVHYDPKVMVKLICDASDVGIGAVLLHTYADGKEKPIAFGSRILSSCEKRYSTVQKEALAVYWGVRKFAQYLMGRKFILMSDQRSLVTIFGENKEMPSMAAGRLQRWALHLAQYDYVFQYIKGEENCADGLSRLPGGTEKSLEKQTGDARDLNFLENSVPIDSNRVRAETRKDVTLSRVLEVVLGEWPKMIAEDLRPYHVIRKELSVEEGMIMWGCRVVIPTKLREQLLKELHVAHFGMVKLKETARSHFWWPKLNEEIEEFVRKCEVCLANRPDPAKARVLSWPKVGKPFERIHADFLGPVRNSHYLIVIDAYSKWPEVFKMQTMGTVNTLNRFRETCARYGLPETICTDNGGVFGSQEFSKFCSQNGIRHVTIAPGHPATNGAAENAVKTFKSALYKTLTDPENKHVDVETLVSRYLMSYRNSFHMATEVPPSQLMFSRTLTTRLTLLKKNLKKAEVKPGRKREKAELEEGEQVWVRDYRGPNKKAWVKATVEEVLGPRTFFVRTEEELVWKRHLDQVMKTSQRPQRTINPPKRLIGGGIVV
jgi:hypothetical protein